MARLILETRPASTPLEFSRDSSDLVWFLSFAAVEQYGSQHELSLATTVLRHKHKLRLRPLLRFTSADDDDPEELERSWQPAGPLADTAAQVREVIARGDDQQLAAYTRDYPDLAPLLGELEALARRVAEQEGEVRMTYEL